jgi:hypothetical protein
VSEATFDWLTTPIGQPQQPTPQPPQLPWDQIFRWLPWVLLVAAAVFFYAKQSPADRPGVAGLRVLVVEETADRSDLTPDQIAIFNSVKLRDEIDAAKGQILFLDADDKTRELAPEWQRLRDRIQTRPPAVVIATPRRAKEMKLPASVDDFLAAIEGAK